MAETLKEIKEKLQSLGISTDTPGIKGHDRREELANRLEEALFQKAPSRSPKRETAAPISNSAVNFATPDMANLSMAEIRSRLTMLGESTATPGLSGEDRRRTLVKRLMDSICGNDGGDDESGKDIMNKTFEQRLDEEIRRPDPEPIASPLEGRSSNGFASTKSSPLQQQQQQPFRARDSRAPEEKTQEEVDNENLAQLEQTRSLERKKMSELGEAKKRMSALTNKRSVMISARFSGPMQDERLREVTKRLAQTESESLRMQSLLAKEAKKHPPGGGQVVAKGSSELVNEGKSMDLEKILSRLSDMKSAIKEKIKWHKTRIRCEEENHEEYGVECENAEQNNVQEINFEISKIKRQIDLEQSRVGKTAVARWDMRQKELKAQQLQEEQQQHHHQQQLPSSTPGNEQQYAFGHHGYGDDDDDDIEISLPTQGMQAGGGGGGGGMFGPDVDFADLDSQFNSMLTSGPTGQHQEEDDDEDRDRDMNSTEHRQDDMEGGQGHGYGDDDEDFAPPVSLQKAPSPPKPPVKEPAARQAAKTKKQPAGAGVKGKAPAAKPAPAPAGAKSKKPQASQSQSKTASDTDLDSFISKMDPNNAAKLNTDDDVLEKKLALLRQRSGVGIEVDRSAPPSKEDISKVSPHFKPPTRSSPQKTVLTSAPKPTVSKKDSSTEDKPNKSKATTSTSTTSGDSKNKKKETYRGEAEINRMMGLNDDDLLKKTKELELQMKSMAAAAKKNKPAANNNNNNSNAPVKTKTLTYEQEEAKRQDDMAVQRSAAAPQVVSPFDPKKADKQYRNKNRPPANTNTNTVQSKSKRAAAAASAPPSKKKTSPPHTQTGTVTGASERGGDPWKKNNTEEDSEDDGDDDEDENVEEEEGGDEHGGGSDDVANHTPAIERAEPTVLSPSSKAAVVAREDMEQQEEEEEDHGHDEEGEGDESEEDEEDSEEQRKIDAQVKTLRMRAVELEQAGQFDEVEETLLRALELNPMDMRSLDSFATFLHRKRGELGRAEAFYRRAIQVCVPSLMDELKSPRGGHDDEEEGGGSSRNSSSWQDILDHERSVPGGASSPPPVLGAKGKRKGQGLKGNEVENSSLSIGSTHLTRVHIVTQVLLHYATFLRRAKGDIEVAGIVLRKAADISPTDAVVLGSCAHHLVEDHMSPENIRDATDMFKRAFKNDPSNINNFLWYAKLLHKTGKLSEAELMFKVAMQKTQGEGKMGAAATCNYAMFLYKYRNKIESADTLFKEGLERHPRHKGLMKSYKAMLRDMKSKKMKETSGPDSGPPARSAAPGKHEREREGGGASLSPVKESELQSREEEEEEDEEEYVKVKPVKKKKDSKKKEKRKSSHKNVENKKREGEGEGKATRRDEKHSTPADDSGNIDEREDDGTGIHAGNNKVRDEDADFIASRHQEDGGQEDNSNNSDHEDCGRTDNGVEYKDDDCHSPLPQPSISPRDKDPSTPTVSDRGDSRGSSRGSSSRGSSRGSSSRGLKARLYERVNSAGCRDHPIESPHGEEEEEEQEQGTKQLTPSGSPTTKHESDEDNINNDDHDGDDDHDVNTEHDDSNADDEDEEEEEEEDDDDIIVSASAAVGKEKEEEEDYTTLAINTSFGTEDGLDHVLPDDLDDEVTAPDSFTEDLEKRGVITPHHQHQHQHHESAASSEEIDTNTDTATNTNPRSSAAQLEDGGGGSEESVEISFVDITCYDIYMFHLRSTHGDNIEADAANRISLYWTVKVYPDTTWENETATQRVSDEKNSAIWRFPADNDDSFVIKSSLHLCFLLFEATNDTLLGSAIFPGQDVVNAGLAGGEDVYEIDDEIICEDGVTVIGQLQAKVKFVV